MPLAKSEVQATRKFGILYVEDSIGVGGSLVSLCNLLQYLDKRRFTVHVLLYHESQKQYLESRYQGAANIIVAKPRQEAFQTGSGDQTRRWMGGLGRVGQRVVTIVLSLNYLLTSVIPYAVRMAIVFRKTKIKLIHLNTGICLPGVLLARLLNVKCIATQRGPEWLSPIIRWFSRGIYLFTAISEKTRADLIKLGVEDTKILVMNPPVDLAVFNPQVDASAVRKEYNVQAGEMCIGIVGMLQKWKGQHIFLEGIRQILVKYPETRAFIIGDSPSGNNAYRTELLRLCEDLKISQNVVFTGFRKDVPELMQMLDVVVHASTIPEPFGKVAIEAMAMKKPIIATNAGGPAEIIEDGCDGFLIPMNDPSALARRIEQILSNKTLANKVAQAGFDKARRLYGVQAYVTKITHVYHDIVEKLT